MFYVNLHSIGFIGAGNIATAIFGGQLTSGRANELEVHVFDTDPAKVDAFVGRGAVACDSTKELVEKCEYIFLTVKPQVYKIVLSEISSCDMTGKCFIDIGAGITTDFVRSFLGRQTQVIRVMPNTPLLVGFGATAVAADGSITKVNVDFVNGIFSCCGKTEFVDESDINTVTAVSGSSPAFVFRFAKAAVEEAAALGMSEKAALNLFAQTLIGSAHMLTDSGMTADELIKMVSSPNGTTVAGLAKLTDGGFDEAVANAVRAAKERADELAKQ